MIKHKFKAKPQEVDGWYVPSKKEAHRYIQLKQLVKSESVLFFIPQVAFRLPGKTKYICDFVVFWADGFVTFEDVKGFKTETYILKKKIVESLYPIEITEI